MKYLRYISLLLLLTLGWAGVSQAAVALNAGPETVCSVTSSSTPTCVFDAALTSGSTLVARVAIRTAQSITSVADGTNGTWTCPAGANHSDGITRVIICYFNGNTSTGTPTVTLTMGGASVTYWNLTEWTGVATSTPEDGNEVGTDTTSPFAVTTGLTTTTAGVIVCASATDVAVSSPTPASGFTQNQNNANRDYFQYRIGSATTSDCGYTATGPTTTSNSMLGLKEAAAAGGGAAPRGLLLGVW